MTSHTSKTRLSAISSHLDSNKSKTMSKTQSAQQLPWDPNALSFPSHDELPSLPDAPEGAAWVWGKDDQLGRLNLLTPERVKASATEIKTGDMVRLDLPLNVPATPAFGREVFQHNIKPIIPDMGYDDTYVMNTQSSTQWDGFRHFCHVPTKTFYNGAKSSDFVGDKSNLRCSIHHWAEHGIAGRGVLLDYHHYAHAHSKPYNPYKAHEITFSDLQACAQFQGLDIRPESQGGDIRPGDILLVRSGFVQEYHKLNPDQRHAAATRQEAEWAGLSREKPMRDWLHDCYFAAAVGDSPTFEVWPPPGFGADHVSLHQSMLSLWGCPIGEMWDLENLAVKCRDLGKWTFFMTSAPANMPGGVGSHANATAIL
ncbi:uncharacterized protein N7469_008146 [Penicillium citrinum]|uniref:Cyclase n=1 Tax=Penicillium citrinum TaxID=5077 RepID=A0A9W9TJ57_PENCI|nr:uncharacterized protein N7469_008146 [Penicillium citrinum]KAJ5224643.1 hypothetical protein N7469_008146 [Penicillium citrinum]